MYDNNSKGISYAGGFFMLIALAVAGLFLSAKMSEVVWNMMTGLRLSDLEENMNNPAYSNALKVLQVLTAIFGFFLPAVVTAGLMSKKPFQLLGYTGGVNSQQIGLTVLIMGASLAVATGLSYVNAHIPIPETWKIEFMKMEDNYNRQVEAIVGLKNTQQYLVALIVMALIPAICEETLFRGGLQNFLTRSINVPWISIVCVSIIFSIVHLSFYGFLSRFFLGIVLGALYHYSGKLWLSILAHFINNALALTVLFFYIRQGRSLRDAMKSDPDNFWGLVVLPIVIVLFIVFKKASGRRRFA